MRVLALDLATTTGYAVSRPDGGAVFSSRKIGGPATSDGKFFHDFEVFIGDIIATEDPEAIVYEAPILWGGQTDIRTAKRLITMSSLVEKVGWQRAVPKVFSANMSDVRMWLIGRTRGKLATETDNKNEERRERRKELKAAIIAECRRRGWDVATDDEADARALLAWAVDTLIKRSAA